MTNMNRTYDYSTIQDYVSRLLKDRETAEVEFKSAKGGFPSNFWSTYSAFANTHGGTIILGVKEHDDLFTLNGLTEQEVDKLQKDFWSGVHNKNTVNACLLNNNDVQVAKIEEQYVLLFYVPQAAREQRPVHCTRDAFGGTYRRNHEGDYQCSQNEVRRMFADADISQPADSRILRNYSWDDIDIPSLEQYRRLFAIAKPNHPWLALDNLELMKKLGGYRKNRETGEEGFTLAGLLMFGKYDSIRDVSCVPKFFPDFRNIPMDTTQTRWLDRVCPDGMWEANLFQFYRRVLPKLQEVIPVPFKLEGNQRRDDTPAHEALREAFANLCVHADYSEDASLVVLQYPSKIVFSNPGVMLISKYQYYQGGKSVCRNTSLQQMFMMLGSAEKAGSGADKILKGWEHQNWKNPYLIENAQPNEVELVMPLDSLMDKKIVDYLESMFGSIANSLGKNEILVLSLALTEEMVYNERLQSSLNMHPADITRLLQKLCRQGFLTTTGHGRGTQYRLTAGNPTSTSRNPISSEENPISTSRNPISLEENPISEVPKYVKRDELKKMVLDFCSEWRTAAEIAQHVGRTRNYITADILPKMADVLTMAYPQSKRNPNQKYIRKETEEIDDMSESLD